MKCHKCGAKISMPEQLKDYCIEMVVFYTGVSLEEMCSTTKTRRIYFARYIAMYLLYEFWIQDVSSVGMVVGRDHTTVSSGMIALRTWRSTDEKVDELVKAIESKMIVKRQEILEESFSQ